MNIEELETTCADHEFIVRFGRTGKHRQKPDDLYFCCVEALMGTKSLGCAYASDLQVAKRTAMTNALNGY